VLVCLAKSSWRVTTKECSKGINVTDVQSVVNSIVARRWYGRRKWRIHLKDNGVVDKVVTRRDMSSCEFGFTDALVIGRKAVFAPSKSIGSKFGSSNSETDVYQGSIASRW
jgi:hypothetical protein